MHRTLARQLRKLDLTPADLPSLESWRDFVTQVADIYQSNDDERRMAERAMEISSKEMRTLMDKLAERNSLLQREIEKHADTSQKLKYAATHDALTGLPSRSVMLEELGRCLGRGNTAATYAILFIDLDDFKIINDSLGHNVGDEVLKHFSKRLCEVAGRAPEMSPLVCRLGGDEFVVLLRSIKTADNVVDLAGAIRSTLSETVELAGQRLTLSASVGVLFGTPAYREAGELLRDADTAMYRAKHAGKGRHAVFDAAMHLETLDRLRMEQDLRAAIEQDQFRVVYQPLVNMESGQLYGFESLLRWHHPAKGLLLPASFMDMAEQSGQIVPVGKQALLAVCKDIALWRAQGLSTEGFSVAVNFSRRQIKEGSIIEDIKEACRSTGIHPSSLTVELTENAFVSDAESLTRTCTSIQKLGCQLHMDDFGTGLSSLSSLHEMPFDGVKIDRSFVSRITQRREHTAIVSSIIMLAHNLGLRVVAEGIETIEQLVQLQACDCDLGQGYLFARPLEPQNVPDWFHRAGEHRSPLRMAA